jgi:molybdate transport system permease protein
MPIDWFPLWLSLRVAVIATLIAMTVGVWLAYVLANHEFRGKAILAAAVHLALLLPPTVIGFYVLVLLGRTTPLGRLYESVFGAPLLFTWQAAVLAALLYTLPLLVDNARAAFEEVGARYGRAALSLGASEWNVFWRVILPLARRPILAAGVLAFARSLGDFGITIMIAGNLPGATQTMPVAIYSAVESGNGAAARALVAVISALVLGLLYLATRLGRKRAAA